jgi:putative acetyltransferase
MSGADAPRLPDGLAAALVRPVVDADADGLIALIGAAYAEHPGCVLDLPGVDADLVAPASSARVRDVAWWVVVEDDVVVASVAHGPLVAVEGRDAPEMELKRLYVARSHRRRGLASALVASVVERADERGAAALFAWSDTRFVDAHRMYERLGFVRSAFTRDLDDPSCTCEAHFRLGLRLGLGAADRPGPRDGAAGR